MNELTIGEVRELQSLFQGNVNEQSAFSVGAAYFIRTCTYHLTGRVRAIQGGFLVLDDVAWIADSGRFADALKTGELAEVEPMPDGTLVALGAITDASPWNHALPKEQK